MKRIVLIFSIFIVFGEEDKNGATFTDYELDSLRSSFIKPGDENEINSILMGTYKTTPGPSLIMLWDQRDAKEDKKPKCTKKSCKKKKINLDKGGDSGHLICPACNRNLTLDGLTADDPCYDCGAIWNEYY